MTASVSIVMPIYNEASGLEAHLMSLQALRTDCEIIAVDGGSNDSSPAIALPLVDCLIGSPRGRARQMNAGAALAGADILLFLHADTVLPPQAPQTIRQALADGGLWGRFDLGFDSAEPIFTVIAAMMNWRSRLTGVATGDQAIFVRKSAFEAVRGFPEIDLMEDIALSKILKSLAPPCCLRAKVLTSARRWRNFGVLRTIVAMWVWRWRYFCGADPALLAAEYYKDS